MKGKAFCRSCGKTDVKLTDGLCSTCFIENPSLISIPDKIEVITCTQCGSIQKKGRWYDSDLSLEDQLAETIQEHVEVDDWVTQEEISIKKLNIHGSTFTFLVEITGRVLKEELTREFPVEVKVNKNVCNECSKYASGYYEAVIQLRAEERFLSSEEIKTADSIIENRIEKLSRENRMAYISQRVNIKEGIDYYIGSYKAARKLTESLKNRLGGVVKESPRLMGHDKSTGKDLFRIWILLRLPNFFKGDFVEYNEFVAQITNFDGDKIYLKYLESSGRISVPWRDVDKLEIIAHKEDIKTVMVSAKTPKYIQILHPETYEPVDIPITTQIKQVPIGEEVDVAEIRGVFYLLIDQKDFTTT